MSNPAGERFWALYEPNSRLFTSIAYRLLRDADAARDVLQDSVVKALRGFSRLRDPERFVPWMSTIVAHEACSYLRKNKRRTERETSAEERLFPANEDVEEKILRGEAERHLGEALAGLNREDRMLLYLRFQSGMQHREIAAAMGLSTGAARSRLSRILHRLREVLDQEEVHP